ncbi:hypothetical protein, partial [Belliella pelovolcani]|uniref:hypothetical protein n=1 Tax=Belliella pelovolcani TaxID=529505 RepID=UPI001C37D859
KRPLSTSPIKLGRIPSKIKSILYKMGLVGGIQMLGLRPSFSVVFFIVNSCLFWCVGLVDLLQKLWLVKWLERF